MMNKTKELSFLLENPDLKIDTSWVVITGAPSSGKTTLIEKLNERGYLTNPDISRRMIETRLADGMTLDQIYKDEALFQSEILCEMILNLQSLSIDQLIFHDYSLPDNIPYLKILSLPILNEYRIAARMFRFKKIFVCSPLILHMDGVRRETPADQVFLDKQIREVYHELGYPIIELPAADVEQRLNIILANIIGQ